MLMLATYTGIEYIEIANYSDLPSQLYMAALIIIHKNMTAAYCHFTTISKAAPFNFSTHYGIYKKKPTQNYYEIEFLHNGIRISWKQRFHNRIYSVSLLN